MRTGIHLDVPGKKTSLDHFLVGMCIHDQVVLLLFLFIVVQSQSHVQLFETPWTAAFKASLYFIISQSLLKLISIESMMPSNHLILCYPLLLLLSIFSSLRVFSNESALHIKWPKDWSFSISPSNEYSGLISFSIDWFDHHQWDCFY